MPHGVTNACHLSRLTNLHQRQEINKKLIYITHTPRGSRQVAWLPFVIYKMITLTTRSFCRGGRVVIYADTAWPLPQSPSPLARLFY